MLNTITTTHTGSEAGDFQTVEGLQRGNRSRNRNKIQMAEMEFKKNPKQSVSGLLKLTRVKVRHPQEKLCECV